MLALASYPAGDTSRARRVALETLALADSLTPAERESDAFATLGGIGGKRAIYMVMFLAVSTDGIALDSLRHSTPAYVRFIRGMWPKDMGRPSDALFIIGEKAPPIVGDFWAPSEAASRPRPTPGHVALVMFLEHADCLYGLGGMTSNGTPEVSPQCFALAASLHRLAQRFPALQITTVTRTRGHFAYVSSPPPADEASLIEREMAAYHLPGALAIASTPFWRLPAPDDRRIDKPVANETHYRFGTNQSVADGTLFLIDQSGTIVYANNGDRWGTLDLSQFIDVLVHRGNDGAANESH